MVLWHFINLTFHQLAILSTYHFINLPFHQLDVLSAFYFINLPFHQLAVSQLAISAFSLMCHFINLPFHQLDISSTCHFINLLFHQLAISSTCHFINLPFHQLAISSTWQFINLPFHQLPFHQPLKNTTSLNWLSLTCILKPTKLNHKPFNPAYSPSVQPWFLACRQSVASTNRRVANFWRVCRLSR